MSLAPRVSVITPFRNAERYLQESIASVRGQTVTDWELILVDDRSTDCSREIAMEWASADSRLRLLDVSEKAAGAAAARNAGIEVSRGTYVAFLDADDIYRPTMLETVLAAAEAHPEAAMIFGPTLWWFPGQSQSDWMEQTYGMEQRLHTPPSLLTRLILLQQGHVPCTCSVLIRRDAIATTGGFEEDFALYEDQTLWAKLLLRFPAFVTPVCLSQYRQHEASASALAMRDGLYERLGPHAARKIFLAWLARHILQAEIRTAGLSFSLSLASSEYEEAPTLGNRCRRAALRVLTLAFKLGRRYWRVRRSLLQKLP